MGALRRIGARLRHKRALAAVGVVAAVVGGAVACQPVDGDLNVTTVAATTDQEATQELNRQNADVAWLSCTGAYKNGGTQGSSSPSEVQVKCTGRTKKGEDITVDGWANGVVSGHCVRGTFIARIEGKVWFRLSVLGNCAETGATSQPPEEQHPSEETPPKETPPEETPSQHEPTHEPTNEQPTRHEPQPGTTRTVTETVTVWPTEPSCSCPQGK
ncbi:hypothetical protein [Streptomyces sp. KL116D]|uniref:hypothetical protein n=1 Tax=Streptomyces sp. KL116D TaxID=3045152 RepID=UPI0035593646